MRHNACTTMLAGKKATIDGSTIIARDEDFGNVLHPKRFVVIKPEEVARHYAAKTTAFSIDLPADPLRYTSVPDVSVEEGLFPAAGINSANVAMTATETSTTNPRVLGADPYNTKNGFGEEDIVTLVLPYVHSAREAVARLGHLLEQYGTYEPNGIGISDADEVWYFETIGGHHWAAQRIPDDAYVIAPNRFNITDFKFSSRDTMCSADLPDFIREHHLNPDKGQVNLRHIFGSATVSDTLYNNPRAWYVQQHFGNSLDRSPEDQNLPFICHADRKLSVEDFKFALSSHFQGTPYDPYGHGDQAHDFRPIGINRNLDLHILQIRNTVGQDHAAIHWLAFGPEPYTTVIPFYANTNDTPKAFRDTPRHYDPQYMYWAANTLAIIADTDYKDFMFGVESADQKLMGDLRNLQEKTDRAVGDQPDVTDYLTQVNLKMGQMAMDSMTKLTGTVVGQAFKQMKLKY